jgi:hypothetical protein
MERPQLLGKSQVGSRKRHLSHRRRLLPLHWWEPLCHRRIRESEGVVSYDAGLTARDDQETHASIAGL